MKVFVEVENVCAIHKASISNFLERLDRYGAKIVTNVQEAEYIVYMHCVGSGKMFDEAEAYIREIAIKRKENSVLIAVACVTETKKIKVEELADYVLGRIELKKHLV